MRPLIPALAASALIAAAIAWTPLPGGRDAAPSPDPARASLDPSAAAPAASPAVADLHFAPDAAASAAAAAAPKPLPPQLVGLGGAGRTRTAYIMADGQPVRVHLGDKIGRWRLSAIGPHSVTLRAGRKTMSLAFFGPRPTPPPPPVQLAEQPSDAPAPAQPAPAPPPPVREHALEPASAPVQYAPPPRTGPHPCYYVGSAASAPKGCIVLKPGQLPPE